MKSCWLLAFLLGCAALPVKKDMPVNLDPGYANGAIALSIECTQQESPHYYDRTCEGCASPKTKHPAFFGCFDWHSSVHGHWAMLHLLGSLSDFPMRKDAISILQKHLTPANMKRELEYFSKRPSFELPYGYGWYLRLVAEAKSSPLPEAKKWFQALDPMAKDLAKKLVSYLSKMNLPMREGAHMNTAFALTHAWDYAKITGDTDLLEVIGQKSREFYSRDHTCPLAYEPSSGDFISPCFVEADLMRRVLGADEFRNWFDLFMPSLDAKFLEPVVPLDPKDYILGHLIGLMYQKAAAMRGVASALPISDPRKILLIEAATAQSNRGWKLLFDSGYGGTHWIASFAIYHYGGVGI